MTTACVAGGLMAGIALAEDPKAVKPEYPLDTCVVSGEKLGEMGSPVIFEYEGREVRFCCKGCKKTFLKDPAKYLKMIDDAAKAKETAKAATGEKPVEADHVHGAGDAHDHH